MEAKSNDTMILIEANPIQAVFGDKVRVFKRLTPLMMGFCLYAQGLDFSTAPILSDNSTFGAVSIGGVQTTITHQSGEMQNFKDYKDTRNAVIFGLKRGFMFLDSKTLLLNAWIDGRAGQEKKNGLYAFSLGAQVGYRFFNGRMIGLIGGGFEMSNLATPEPKEQYNIYGGVARAELFFDIAKGYGLSVSYTQGFNYRSKKLINERFDTSSIMISISYYDFSI
ncbi:hypothetical protein [Helicobacter typhlonius]|uniref:hypothetical protein n=1 Tax=Helicobacter typhlonius TaxID=76936 RepID=UPI002FE0CEFB